MSDKDALKAAEGSMDLIIDTIPVRHITAHEHLGKHLDSHKLYILRVVIIIIILGQYRITQNIQSVIVIGNLVS